MIRELWALNLLSWITQVVMLATLGALLPALFRIRHPRTRLIYCHLVLLASIAWPLAQLGKRWTFTTELRVYTLNRPVPAPESGPIQVPRRPIVKSETPSLFKAAQKEMRTAISSAAPYTPIILMIVLAGCMARICLLLAGLWRIRRYRIAATPLHPIPEPVAAAFALTNAHAVVCVSPRLPGPVMLGLINPVVLLPESFLELNPEAQCGIACHELLHVRRRDWLFTLFEELAGAIMWFNPGAWWLLAQTRLAREQLVDAEAVRLTAARESYIDALLAIARAGASLDLAPAPLFLRRRHLTQRMHLLLREVSMSKSRLISSYASSAAILLFAGWLAAASFPLIGRAQVIRKQSPNPSGAFSELPVPADPHELVSGAVHFASTPADRAAALSLLEQARQNANLHIVGTPPFILNATFTAGGNVAFTGSGSLSETWVSGRSWRWTQDLGSYSQVRIGANGQIFDDKQAAAVPIRVQMLRGAIFAPIRLNTSGATIRTAAAQLNGRPVTCILTSRMSAQAAQLQARLWEETEYCVDSASGLLQVYSDAPGTYIDYGYSRNLQFHGRSLPDQVMAFVGGALVLNAQINISDLGSIDENLMTPTAEMIANGPAAPMMYSMRFPTNVAGLSGNSVQPVIVHATIGRDGHVIEEELSAVSEPGLAQQALDVVKQTSFSPAGSQQEAYINLRFLPVAQ